MGGKKAKGDAQARTENANTKKENRTSTDNATAEDGQATTGYANTRKENGISTGNAAAEDAQASTENANIRKEKGMSTENAAAQDTKNKLFIQKFDAARKIDIWHPCDSDEVERVLRSQGATTSGDKGKGKQVVRVDDKALADAVRFVNNLRLQPMVTSEEVGDTPKTGDSSETLTEKLALDGYGKNLRARAVNKGDGVAGGKKGIDGSEATTENTNTEEEKGDSWDGDRVPRSQGSSSSSGDTVEGKKVVRIGDKAVADAIQSIVKVLTLIMIHCEEVVKVCDKALAINNGDEIAGGKKGIDGFVATKKAKGKKSAAGMPATKAGNGNDEVTAATTSTEIAGGKKGIDGIEAAKKTKEKKSAAGTSATKPGNGYDEVIAATSTEIASGKKGIDDSEAANKAKGKESGAPKVENDNDEVKAVTKTSVRTEECEAVNSVEKRNGHPRKSRRDPRNK